jgi:FMN phosphatase YigB (HAD superfamily)
VRIAIVHYHLGHGGVTGVIDCASRHLTENRIPHVILASQVPAPVVGDLPVRWVDGLSYHQRPEGQGPDELLVSLRAAASEALGGPPDLWHFHNPSLGKNPWMAGVVARLAEAGERLLLQLHDLAEDGRARNYRFIRDQKHLYPVSETLRYAFLNSRDLECFTAAGLPAEHAVLLANPIAIPPGDREVRPDAPALLFAPVRGIRRKNLGELVFLSALLPAGARIAVSRAPENPDAISFHSCWREFAMRHAWPIDFDVVERVAPSPDATPEFASWLHHATHFITTSVAEGFGLPFLESIAHGKPLLGRNLPHLAKDHAAHGIHHSNLYDHLLIPASWIDEKRLEAALQHALDCDPLHHGNPRRHVECGQLRIGGDYDFANLPEDFQREVIERLSDPSMRHLPRVRIQGRTQPAEDWLAAAIGVRRPDHDASSLAAYSPVICGRQLVGQYTDILRRPLGRTSWLEVREVLRMYHSPGSFHFLKSETVTPCRAIIFDIYGTLLHGPAGGVRPDPAADPLLRKILGDFGHSAPQSPSMALHQAVVRHHQHARVAFPEVDLRELWKDLLSLPPEADTAPLVKAIERAWHPTRPMPGAAEFVKKSAAAGIPLGLLSNAQCDSLDALGEIGPLFAPELSIFSYQHGMAKPSPRLFDLMVDRLDLLGIPPDETLYLGNDPKHDILPAAAAGFRTALFTGHPDSLRPGDCMADFVFEDWKSLTPLISSCPLPSNPIGSRFS